MRWLIILAILVAAATIFLGQESEVQNEIPLNEQPAQLEGQTLAQRKSDFQAAAYKAGVQLVGFKTTQRGAVVSITWKGNVTAIGGDFLNQCLNDGLFRDMDVAPISDLGVSYNKDGQRVWSAQYTVHF